MPCFARAFALLAFVSAALHAQTAVDPALTVGTLPNGMRYYLRGNRIPAHRVELRLVVNAGSVLEDDDQRGFAHFLEHMAFDGTKHFPGHTLIDFVETSGMRFGADLNAHTTQDETIYTLTLPSDDHRILERGLDILQDWSSGEIRIDSAAVTAERGIVMGEWRTRLLDTASQTVQAHSDTLWFGGTRYLTRKPIGDTALIETATPAPIRRFYRNWYRPDLMTVVVVGDFDRAAMEREIRVRFASIPASATPRPHEAPDLPTSITPVVDIYRGSVLPSIEMLWPIPPAPRQAKDAARLRLIHDVLADWVSERFLRLQSHPSRPFITVALEEGRLTRSLHLRGFEMVAWPDSLERGLETVLAEIERVAQHGIPPAALAHEKAVIVSHLEHAAASTEGHSSEAYADAYVDHALTGEGSLLSAGEELALAREILPTLNSDAFAQAARVWLTPVGERVLVNLPQLAHVPTPTRERVLALIDSIEHTSLVPDSDQTVAERSLLATLPTPGQIIGERKDRVAGITEWTLSNGARVILKPTPNNSDDVRIRAWSPGGFAAMPDSLFFSPGRMVGRVMTDIGGLGSMTHDALAQQLATTGLRSMRVDIGYQDESIQVAGSPTELETLFQLLHLQFTAPMVDTAALAGWQSLAKYQGRAVPVDDEISRELAHGNARMLPVSTQVAELATVQNLMAAYRDRFGDAGTFTFTIVGAMTDSDLRPLVERYIASLPAARNAAPKKPAESHITMIGRVNTVSKTLELPKALTLMLFDGRFPDTPVDYLRERQRLSALVGILNDRLRVRLRQELSGTYSPTVTSETYALPEERYRVMIVFDAAPGRISELNHAMMSVIDSLRTYGVSDAEAARQATVQRRQLETRLQDNGYWMATIGTYARLGIPLDAIPAPYAKRAVTASELQAAARLYLPDDAYIVNTQMPADST